MSIETGPNTLNTTPRHIHFLGICGTAMGSVAAAMQDKGFQVTGQDQNVYPPMSTFLESKGVKITPGFNPADIPAADLIVIGNAILRPFRAMTYLASLVEPPKRADAPKKSPQEN